MTTEERYAGILDWFSRNMQDAQTELQYDSVFHLLIAVILSAQCTDKRVNMHTPEIFRKYPVPASLAEADVDEVFLNSKGEVLLSNCFDPVVDLIKRHGIAIRLMSNGYLLNSKDYRDTVNRIDEVVAEVDMTTESTYREIKRPLEHYSLKQYTKNLELL